MTRAERRADGGWDVTTDPAGRAATTRSSSPTATTGTRAGPSRRSPGRIASPACSCTRTSTPATTRALFRDRVGRGARDGQLGDGHRGRVVVRRPPHLPRRPARRVGDPEVRPRPPAGLVPRARPRADRAAQAGAGRDAAAGGRRHGALRPAEARPPVRRRPPDGVRRHPLAHRARRGRAEAEHRRADRAHGALRRRQRGGRRRRRLLHRLQGHVPVPRPRPDRGARQRPAAVPARLPSGGRRDLLRRPAAADRRDHAARRAAVGSGSATTSPGATSCRPRTRCAPTSRPSARRCSSATSAPSATRCRSTSRTTCSASSRSAGRGAKRAAA